MASGRCQYSVMTFGPINLDLADLAGRERVPRRIHDPHVGEEVGQAAGTRLVSRLISGERLVAPGEVSVIPYPLENARPRPS